MYQKGLQFSESKKKIRSGLIQPHNQVMLKGTGKHIGWNSKGYNMDLIWEKEHNRIWDTIVCKTSTIRRTRKNNEKESWMEYRTIWKGFSIELVWNWDTAWIRKGQQREPKGIYQIW